MTLIDPLIDPLIVSYYTEYDEASRLHSTAVGRLEFERTRELLRRSLPPPPARVLDVGGGPGTHARWLIEDGYQVLLVDPVPKHVEQAREYAPGCSAELGDARRLALPSDGYDVVLLLGPLYHLSERGGGSRRFGRRAGSRCRAASWRWRGSRATPCSRTTPSVRD